MNSLIALWSSVANELATRCRTSATRDLETVSSRTKDEGISFLTITLPRFGKDFERCLDQGDMSHNLFQGFSWQAGLPRFLGGFLERIFDRNSGSLLNNPEIESIYAIRQLTLMFGKIELDCSDTRIRSAFSGFVECEHEVKEFGRAVEVKDLNNLHRIAMLLYSSMFTRIDSAVYHGSLFPKHGPGATADRIKGNLKYDQRTWPARLEDEFPYLDFCLPNASYHHLLDDVHFIEPGAETPVRVISVPKTLVTPRIIAIEPVAMQYAQQSLLHQIQESIKHSYLNGFIGLDEQEPNQLLAQQGSRSQDLATLDLSEASDRVSNLLVRTITQNFPWFSRAIQACRSTRADVPGHGVIPLSKFASMGSALTFPMEALVFLAIVFHGIERELGYTLTKRSHVTEFLGSVRVYGDDIIVPIDYVHSVRKSLALFGAKVNSTKSFWTGKFRESCGKEYYDGEDVSIVRLRHLVPRKLNDVTEFVGFVAFRNLCYTHGLWKTASLCDSVISRITPRYPNVASTSPVLGRVSFLGYETEKMHPSLHVPLVKGHVVRNVSPQSMIDEHVALTKFFIRTARMKTYVPSDEGHLERSGRPLSVGIKTGWYTPY